MASSHPAPSPLVRTSLPQRAHMQAARAQTAQALAALALAALPLAVLAAPVCCEAGLRPRPQLQVFTELHPTRSAAGRTAPMDPPRVACATTDLPEHLALSEVLAVSEVPLLPLMRWNLERRPESPRAFARCLIRVRHALAGTAYDLLSHALTLSARTAPIAGATSSPAPVSEAHHGLGIVPCCAGSRHSAADVHTRDARGDGAWRGICQVGALPARAQRGACRRDRGGLHAVSSRQRRSRPSHGAHWTTHGSLHVRSGGFGLARRDGLVGRGHGRARKLFARSRGSVAPVHDGSHRQRRPSAGGTATERIGRLAVELDVDVGPGTPRDDVVWSRAAPELRVRHLGSRSPAPRRRRARPQVVRCAPWPGLDRSRWPLTACRPRRSRRRVPR